MKYFFAFLLALAPVTELRGALPIAILNYHLAFWPAILVCVLGTALAGVVFLIILKYVEILINKWPWGKKIKDRVFDSTQSKYSKRFESLKELLVFILAAIPVPLIGGSYTAALVSYIFGANKTKSIIFIFLGVIIQGIIIAFSLKLF
jgi:uncharacterized membrane protein